MKPIASQTKQLGIILISTISILALIASFILSSMQNTFLYQKSLNQALNKHRVLESLEDMANQLMLPNQNPRCLIDEKQPSQIIQILKNKQGCLVTRKEKHYFYLIEKLGSFPCIQSELEAIKYGTQHQRITLFSPDENAILQLRIASLESLSFCDKHAVTTVLPGILSWRYFVL